MPSALELILAGKIDQKEQNTILYKEDAVIAMIAGTAYCIKSLPILSVPNAEGVFCPAILYTYFFLAGAKVLFF